MYRVIKSNQVKLSDEKIIKTETKTNNSCQSDAYKTVSKEIDDMLKLKEKLALEIDNMKKDAHEQEKSIIQRAKDEYKKIIDKAKAQAQEILHQERKKGYEQGYKESIQKYEQLIDEAMQIKRSVHNWKKDQINNLEKDIINLVAKSVEKIIKVKVDQDDEIILNVLKEALDKLTFATKINIRVNKYDFNKVDSSKNKILAMNDCIDEINVRLDETLQKGGIVIDTDSGMVNPSIDKQIETLKEELFKLLQGDD
ncbi:flagellar assembly protein FliH [Alkalithermobacter thermoalcaliphilus JW-YL-7 = DSM 7308]|uniref:Flagellar assembly protein FliH n=1 Tax=Alkalithermobacter thermoalcaliphilus JW-YL-7 = DSM 7308 TaxID=1121328 RepID=A0A150FQB8_CLOPD|nr:Flagellar assembly protein FliH/Type III secretion system HrpE [[Clostridium] paradoxum JW-YL-7 = DSM 7308]SHK61465.1 flagellar assembly protein FliH [[Clostridium] paradoxum JW-YL-7 = DSM 7308]